MEKADGNGKKRIWRSKKAEEKVKKDEGIKEEEKEENGSGRKLNEELREE